MTKRSLLLQSASALLLVGASSLAIGASVIEVDNDKATFTGTWTASTHFLLYYGQNYMYARGGGTYDTATFSTPNNTTYGIDVTGEWCVDARWSAAPPRWTAARFQIYDGTTLKATTYKNMTIDGGAWQQLWCGTLTRGQQSRVVLSDYGAPSDRSVIADGVRWVRQSANQYEIEDESGIDYALRKSNVLVSGLSTCSTYTDIQTVTLSPPRNPGTGYIVVRTSGQVTGLAADQRVGIGIGDDSDSGLDSHRYDLEINADEAASGNYEDRKTWSIQEVYTVSPTTDGSYPASRTFYLRACKESSAATGYLYPDDMVVEYHSTRY